jgi:hypothetical protein
MKKLNVLVVLAILILSAIPVYAPGTESGSGSTDTAVASPTLISTDPVEHDVKEVSVCVQRGLNAGLTLEEARRKCAAVATATAVSTSHVFEDCVEAKIEAGLTKEQARVRCSARAVNVITDKAQTCVEKYQEEGLSLEEARRKCATIGMEKVGEQLQTKLDACIRDIKEKYPDVSAEDAKMKCYGLARARVQNVVNFARLNSEEIQKVSLLERARVNELEGLTREQIAAKLGELRVVRVNKEELLRKREIAKNKLEQARERYQQAKERFEEARAKYEERKQGFLEAKERTRACADEESEECEQRREEAQEKARDFIINRAQEAIEYLNKIKERVEANDDLTEEEAAKILQDIDNAIGALEGAVDDAEAAETKEQLQEAAKTIARIWNKAKNRAKLHVARLIHADVGEIITRSRQLEAKLDKVLERMEEAGIDVEGIESKIDDFSEKVEEARELYKQARETFVEAKENTDSDLVKKARDLANNAHRKLKDANRILADIVRSIKQAGGSLEVEEEVEVEVIEEAEEEEAEEELADATTVEDYNDVCELGEDETDSDCQFAEGWSCNHNGICEEGEPIRECDDCPKEDEEEDECVEDSDCEDDEVCLEGECEDKEEE